MIRRSFRWLLLLLLLILLAFAYLLYRDGESSSQKMTNYLMYGTPIAATACPFAGSTFSAASQGSMYVDGTEFRADWLLATQGPIHHAHAVSLDGKTFYTWNDENDTAYTVTAAQLLSDFMFFGLADGTCGPWWFPDTSNIKIPMDRTFVPYAQ